MNSNQINKVLKIFINTSGIISTISLLVLSLLGFGLQFNFISECFIYNYAIYFLYAFIIFLPIFLILSIIIMIGTIIEKFNKNN